MMVRLNSLLCILSLLIAACGGGAEEPAATSQETTAAEQEAPAEQQETTAAEQEAPAEQQETTTEAEAELDDALIAEGEAVFSGAGICMTCHGPDAKGTQLAPDLTDDQWINIEPPVTVEKIENLVKAGVSEPVEHPAPMLPRAGTTITDEQVTAVAAYVYSLSQ